MLVHPVMGAQEVETAILENVFVGFKPYRKGDLRAFSYLFHDVIRAAKQLGDKILGGPTLDPFRGSNS